MGQGQQQTLAELIWAADDWEEPPTLLNHTQNILGLVISFMVCGRASFPEFSEAEE